MGHIRLGRLPKTRRWSVVFDVLEGDSVSPDALARATATAAQQQFAALEGDRAVNYCFWVLVRIVTAARGDDFAGELRRLGISGTEISSGLGFIQQITQMVEKELRNRGQPTVFVRIAELSLREVLSANIIEQSRSLFGTSFEDIQAACRAISTQRRFGEVAKDFFSLFTNRSLQYLTDKEVSNYIGPEKPFASPESVLEFQEALQRYCTETSKIVEDFAAGWFSKNNWASNNNISEETAAAFTAYAFEKIQMELREAEV
jgi:hypothetical protein